MTQPLILGGGPAGAIAATVLARGGAQPVVLERQRETGDALCGGFLSWRSLAMLESLGLDRARLGDAVVDEVRIFAAGRDVSARLPQPALGVSRRLLDTTLLDLAQAAGAGIERGVAIRAFEAGCVRLDDGTLLDGNGIFLATGKHDVRGLARPAEARGTDPAIGLRVRLKPTPSLRQRLHKVIELHLFSRGYAGVVLQEDATANCCMAVHRSRLQEAGDPDALLATIAEEAPLLGEILALRDGASAPDAVANIPYGWRARTSSNGVFRLGDQAGVIPSLAGEGMAIAIASGALAARQWLADGAAAATTYQQQMAHALARPLAIAGWIRDLGESPIGAPWLLRLARVPGLINLSARLTRINI